MMDMQYITTNKEEYNNVYKNEMNQYKIRNCEDTKCKGCNIYVSIEKQEEDNLNKSIYYKISSARKGKCKMLGGTRRFKITEIKT
jgi:hypothetical protein